jgi:predicted MFS family arabinose efflux permease
MNKKKNIKKVIKTFRFWRLTLIQFLITFCFSFIVNTGRTFGALIGIDGSALQFLMICQTASIIIIGPFLGIIVDKKGPLNLLRLTSIVCMIPGILLTFFLNNSFIFIISFMLAVMSLISSAVGFSPFIMETYGIEESVILGGIINTFSKISEAITTVSAFIISLIYSKEEIEKPYRIMYVIGFAFCLLSLILLIFENKEKFDYGKKEEDFGDLVEKERFTDVSK